MMHNMIIVAVIVTAILGYTFYTENSGKVTRGTGKTANSAAQIIALTQDAPDFSFLTLKGEKHLLSDFSGKVIILNFWASWCAPCVIEYPMMLRLAGMVEREAVFLFLSVDEMRQDIDAFLARHSDDKARPNVFIAHDEGKKISQGLYHTYKLPETYIIAPGAVIVEKIIGADVEWDSQGMADKIRALSAKARP